MATKHMLALFVVSIVMSAVLCQTFQYSHGWTNGKRSPLSSLEEITSSINKNAGQLDNAFLTCELQKVRFLLQGNVNHQLLQVPCELFGASKRSFPENVANDQFRHEAVSNSNNY